MTAVNNVMAFISRHEPTAEQYNLATYHGYRLLHIGDMDGFSVRLEDIHERLREIGGTSASVQCHTYCVVHAGLAAYLASNRYTVAVFENENRSGSGEKPQFLPVALHIFKPYN